MAVWNTVDYLAWVLSLRAGRQYRAPHAHLRAPDAALPAAASGSGPRLVDSSAAPWEAGMAALAPVTCLATAPLLGCSGSEWWEYSANPRLCDYHCSSTMAIVSSNQRRYVSWESSPKRRVASHNRASFSRCGWRSTTPRICA